MEREWKWRALSEAARVCRLQTRLLIHYNDFGVVFACVQKETGMLMMAGYSFGK